MWNSDLDELRGESAMALGRAKALVQAAQELTVQAQGAPDDMADQVVAATTRRLSDATRLLLRNSSRHAALTVLESEAAVDRARATVRLAIEECAHARRAVRGLPRPQ